MNSPFSPVGSPVGRLGMLALLGFTYSLVGLSCPVLAPASTTHVSGTIFTVDADHVQTVWPIARITLKNLSSSKELSTVSNDLGQYSFSGVLAGEYELTVKLSSIGTSTPVIA